MTQKPKPESPPESRKRSLAAPPHEASRKKNPKSKVSDARHWMKRVSKLARKAAKDFDERTVHDLRTALRRCRSIAVALEAVDPSDDWQRVENEAGELLDGMSELRDAQVLSALIGSLRMRSSTAGEVLQTEIKRLERRGKKRAAKRLRKFAAKRWRGWTRDLPERSLKLPRDGAVVGLLALEHWKDALRRNQFAVRSRSKISVHKLRVSVKRLRYFVENFLPQRHEQWSASFRKAQDALGDAHDLDVLQSHLTRLRHQIPESENAKWRAQIAAKRALLVAKYHKLASGENSIWNQWRAGLPSSQRAGSRPCGIARSVGQLFRSESAALAACSAAGAANFRWPASNRAQRERCATRAACSRERSHRPRCGLASFSQKTSQDDLQAGATAKSAAGLVRGAHACDRFDRQISSWRIT